MTANDNGTPQRVALYFRVSTDEQAKSGYSIPDQRRTLRERANSEGWLVVEEIEDDGYSGVSPDRPGIRRVYELAEAGEIDMVLATKRDRFFRSRLYMLTTDQDLKDHGVTLVSLSDTGNMIGDSVMDSFAEYEHQLIAERTKSGKVQKARAGKVVGGHVRAYGFDWKRDHDGKTVGYEVNEVEMNTVRRIFSEVAGGDGIRTIKERLDAERVPTPGAGKTWSRPFLKTTLLSDLYRPHTALELRQTGVSEEVASSLDDNEYHGVYRFENIPVPIPDAGIPLEVVLEARRRVESHAHAPHRNTSRPWELRSLLYCEECGRRMLTHSPHAAKGYFYYRCQCLQAGRADPCMMREMVRADRVEPQVWETVRRVLDDRHYVLDKMEEHFAQKRRELTRPGADRATLLRRLDEIDKAWVKYQEAYAADAVSLADLKARKAKLDTERTTIEREMERTSNREAELERLDADEAETRERIEAGYGGLDDATPEKRRQVYEDLRLRVEVGLSKVPRISGIFPIGRYGDRADLLVTTPDQGGYILTTSKSPTDEPPSDRPRHAVYLKDGGGRRIGKELTSSGRDDPSRRP